MLECSPGRVGENLSFDERNGRGEILGQDE